MAELNEEHEREQRFDIALLIVHPTVDPVEIDAELGLAGTHVHPVGAPRVTPAGTRLPGAYPDTRWRHVERHAVSGQHFAQQLGAYVGRLLPHRAYLQRLRDTGGSTEVIIRFLGDDGYFGDVITCSTLTRMAELGLNLGIEVHTVPQNM